MPYRIDLGAYDPVYEGEWVDIKEKRSFADMQRIASAGTEQYVVDGQTLQRIDLVERAVAYFECSIVGWSLKDAQGNPMHMGRAGFVHEDFDAGLGEWLISEINTFYASRSRSKSTTEPAPQSADSTSEQSEMAAGA